jgi:hypothetical protein
LSTKSLSPSSLLFPQGVKRHSLRTDIFNTIIYEKFSLSRDLISKGISGTLHGTVKSGVINGNYREKKRKKKKIQRKIGPAEDILLLVPNLEIFSNSHFNLIFN